MQNFLKKWYDAYFQDEEAIILAIILAVGCSLILLFSQILTPIIAALVIAFLFQGLVVYLKRAKFPHIAAVAVVFLLLVIIEMVIVFLFSTLVFNQFDNLLNELPKLLSLLQDFLAGLPEKYPALVSLEQVQEWNIQLKHGLADFGEVAVTFSQSNIPNLINFFVYLVLVPVFVLFFLKDKDQLLGWFARMLPAKRPLLRKVWNDMNSQMANYIRGKFIEMLIVGITAYITFMLFGLKYAALLAVVVGLSVIVPYVGAFIVTLPVVIVAYLQWGWGGQFIGLSIAYLVIQVLDGNVLVPLLFSEAVNLHPVAILIAILFFGGIWGLWGVFFAIPLATLIKSVLDVWPTLQAEPVSE